MDEDFTKFLWTVCCPYHGNHCVCVLVLDHKVSWLVGCIDLVGLTAESDHVLLFQFCLCVLVLSENVDNGISLLYFHISIIVILLLVRAKYVVTVVKDYVKWLVSSIL